MFITFFQMSIAQSIAAAFFITLGVGQLIGTYWRLSGVSLVGSNRWTGYTLALLLIGVGAVFLPNTPAVVLWVLLIAPLVFVILAVGGSLIFPPTPMDALFEPTHPAHSGCRRIQIDDGEHQIPGFLLTPPDYVADSGGAVCLFHGLGDTKNAFKWRLVRSFLDHGLSVLTIDLPGHGEQLERPLAYPDALSSVSASLRYLHNQAGFQSVGVIGISLGGALAINALAQQKELLNFVTSVVVIGTPVKVRYTDALYYKEVWNTYFGTPVLSLLRETSVKQIWDKWEPGMFNIEQSIDELFDLLDPLRNIEKLRQVPILLIYSRLDSVAPLSHGTQMQQAVPHATLVKLNHVSHVMLTLLPRINDKIARWSRRSVSAPNVFSSNHFEKKGLTYAKQTHRSTNHQGSWPARKRGSTIRYTPPPYTGRR